MQIIEPIHCTQIAKQTEENNLGILARHPLVNGDILQLSVNFGFCSMLMLIEQTHRQNL